MSQKTAKKVAKGFIPSENIFPTIATAKLALIERRATNQPLYQLGDIFFVPRHLTEHDLHTGQVENVGWLVHRRHPENSDLLLLVAVDRHENLGGNHSVVLSTKDQLFGSLVARPMVSNWIMADELLALGTLVAFTSTELRMQVQEMLRIIIGVGEKNQGEKISPSKKLWNWIYFLGRLGSSTFSSDDEENEGEPPTTNELQTTGR